MQSNMSPYLKGLELKPEARFENMAVFCKCQLKNDPPC